MKTMILAAGFGTRLRPYTLICPKPLFPILDRPLLDLLIEQAKRAGARSITVNGHHLREQVARLVAHDPMLSFQAEEHLLGTGGSLRRAVPSCAGEPLLVMNGDIVHDIDLRAVHEYHLHHGNPVTMVLHDYPRFNKVRVENGLVKGFSATRSRLQQRPEQVLAFTGIHVLDPWILRQIPEKSFFDIIDLYRQLIAGGEKIAVYHVHNHIWRDIGTPADYLELHGDLLTGRIHLSCLAKVDRQSHDGCPVFGRRRALVGEKVRMRGWVCLGNGAEIASNTRLERCVVWPGARVRAGDYRDALLT